MKLPIDDNIENKNKMKSKSIGINKWAGEMEIELIATKGEGDNKVTLWEREDGELAIETNGDPVFGFDAVKWIEENR